jgi:hypothetical protein
VPRLRSCYTDHQCVTILDGEWLPWKFQSAPQSFWHDLKNAIVFMEWLKGELKISRYEEWYKYVTPVTEG